MFPIIVLGVKGALARLRAHVGHPGNLTLAARGRSFAPPRFGAPLVELSSVALGDGSQIRLRTETLVDADARLARTDARYTHRHGAVALAEEHARGAMTWYAVDELAELVASAGFRAVAELPSPRASDAGDSGFVVTARA
jgi:hypothetical protein